MTPVLLFFLSNWYKHYTSTFPCNYTLISSDQLCSQSHTGARLEKRKKGLNFCFCCFFTRINSSVPVIFQYVVDQWTVPVFIKTFEFETSQVTLRNST